MDAQKILIVGNGLAGSLLALELIQNTNYSVHVIGSDKKITSSKVAAGLVNPVVFKRLLPSWKANEIVPFLEERYSEYGQLLKSNFYRHISIKKPFNSAEEIKEWKEKSGSLELSNFLDSDIDKTQKQGTKNAEHGYGVVKRSGRLDTMTFLNAVQSWLSEAKLFSNEDFDYGQMKQSDEGWTYNSTSYHKVVFCEGYHVKDNPFFKWIPLKPVKGELLKIKSELNIDFIFNKGFFVMPEQDQQYFVGATYDWKNLDFIPSEEGKSQIIEKYDSCILEKFEIVEHRAAIRPSSNDRRPILGEHPDKTGLFVFNGLGTKGVMLGPWFAKELRLKLTDNIEIDPEVNLKRHLKHYQKEKSN